MMSWDACTLEPNSWLRWIECHPGLGNYFSASLTALAVVTALLISVWMLLQERRHRASATKAQAYRLFSAITFLAEDVERAKTCLKDITSNFMEGGQSIVVTPLLIHGLPNGIMESLHVLPVDVAADVGQLDQLLTRYDRKVRDVFGLSEEAKVKRWAEELSGTLALIEETSGNIYAWADPMTSEAR